jgi:uncharacterized protein (UPF0332 family)
MEQERIESIGIELELAVENFESSLDDLKAKRFRRATSGFYFTLGHLAKALLLTIGVEVESHGAVTRMFGLHFVKSGSLPARVTRHLGSLYERRHTAEYSPRAAWEFTAEEVSTYLEWVKESAVDILKELQKNAPEHEPKLKEINDKLINAQSLISSRN